MRLERDHLVEMAGLSGFEADALEKVLRLGEVLHDLSRHPFLSTVLRLKGGTALNLCFGAPARLSVDLDFNYVGQTDRARMLLDRPEIETAVERLARARGYRVQRSRDEHAGRKTYLGYVSTAGTPERLQVDLNFVHRQGLAPAERRSVWQPADLPRPEVPVVGIEELCIGKLCALLGRTLPRDLFDAVRLPALAAGVWGTQRFRSLFIALAGTLDHPLHSYGKDRFERVSEETIMRHLGPMLHRREHRAADGLAERAWRVVEPLLALSPAEREYTDRVQVGDFRPELLFPEDPETAGRLSRHPALLWKVQNARRHAEGRH